MASFLLPPAIPFAANYYFVNSPILPQSQRYTVRRIVYATRLFIKPECPPMFQQTGRVEKISSLRGPPGMPASKWKLFR